jgi:hypothetical protein
MRSLQRPTSLSAIAIDPHVAKGSAAPVAAYDQATGFQQDINACDPAIGLSVTFGLKLAYNPICGVAELNRFGFVHGRRFDYEHHVPGPQNGRLSRFRACCIYPESGIRKSVGM